MVVASRVDQHGYRLLRVTAARALFARAAVNQSAVTLLDLADDVEHRQVHGDQDSTDDHAHEDDDHRLNN